MNIIKKKDLQKIKRLENGNGPHFIVYEGLWCGATVAIKVCRMHALANHLVSDLDSYRNTSHPNLRTYYGACLEPGKFSMIFELMPFSLFEFYGMYTLSIKNVYNFANAIATGLCYLHSMDINHGHLKSNNIFLTGNLDIKITDFGLHRIRLETEQFAITADTQVNWGAPETFKSNYPKTKDKKADIYSYGVILWEMSARKIPYSNEPWQNVLNLIAAGTTEKIDDEWPSSFKTLLLACWAFDPTSRPTIEAILDLLKTKDFDLENARKEPVVHYNGIASHIAHNEKSKELNQTAGLQNS